MSIDRQKHDGWIIQVGLKIAYYRKLRGLTQFHLAELADISPGYLSQIETISFTHSISLRTVFKIADALDIAPHKLLEFKD